MLISNASTIILLAKVTSLSAFLEDAKEIIIPKIVEEELIGKNTEDALLIKKAIERKNIKIVNVREAAYGKILGQFRLHKGEAAAYSLFKQKRGKALLTDDGELIKLCKFEGTPFITAMTVIVRLFKKKKLTQHEALEKLNNLYHHGWYSAEVYQYFKEQIK